MFSLSIQNEYNRKINLTSMTEYNILEIDGLSPMNAKINEVQSAGIDGSDFNSATAEPRVITIILAINMPAEANRINLYNYMKIKRKHRIFYSNGTRDVYIDGILESMQIGFFDEKELATITFRCQNPYFREYADIGLDIGNTIKLFEFPFEIEVPIPFSEINIYGNKTIFNHGDVETGMIIKIRIKEVNVSTIRIVNVSSNEYFGVSTSLEPGEEIIIDTIDREKSVVKVDQYGNKSNLLGSLISGSKWIKIWPGENVFQLLCDIGKEQYLDGTIVVNTLYQGV